MSTPALGRRAIKVLVVDDSAVVRQVLSTVLGQDPAITVIGTAADPLFAMRAMNRQWPDVLVLDIEMPRMDGLTFLRELMAVRPTPVVICSTLTEQGAQTTLRALSAGAVACVAKPRNGLRQFLESDAAEIASTVKGAAASDMRSMKASLSAVLAHGQAPQQRVGAGGPLLRGGPRPPGLPPTGQRIVAIGTSTGGTQALEAVLSALRPDCPGIVVVQHMPKAFTAAFAERLDDLCACQVVEARDGDQVLPGRVLIAPGDLHLSLRPDGAQYRVRVADGPPVNRHKPSVDVLFRSVAQHAGPNALGVIMTGMGDDGARGLRQMRDAGARTVAQDEASCVIYGMPAEAVKFGAVQAEASLQAIPRIIGQFAGQP